LHGLPGCLFICVPFSESRTSGLFLSIGCGIILRITPL
jgi:hypothetical protein